MRYSSGSISRSPLYAHLLHSPSKRNCRFLSQEVFQHAHGSAHSSAENCCRSELESSFIFSHICATFCVSVVSAMVKTAEPRCTIKKEYGKLMQRLRLYQFQREQRQVRAKLRCGKSALLLQKSAANRECSLQASASFSCFCAYLHSLGILIKASSMSLQ